MTHRVVFVCLHGSAKSVIAAEYLKRLAAERGMNVETMSAGIEPDEAIPPRVTQGLAADGIDVHDRRPVSVTEDILRDADHIVSFGCDLASLAPRNIPLHDWSDVPAVSDGFDTARQAIQERLVSLLDQLSRVEPR
jgi:arsenate reductase (thioredoxin)